MTRISDAAREKALSQLQTLEQIEAALRDGDPEACRWFLQYINLTIAVAGHDALALICRAFIDVMEAAACGNGERLDWLVRRERD